MQTLEAITPTLGAPIDHNGMIGHIVAIRQPELKSYTLGTGKMELIRLELDVVTSDGHKFSVPDTVAAPMLARALARGAAHVDNVESLVTLADKKARQQTLDRAEKSAQATAKRLAFEAECARLIPSWAKAVIIAEMEIDKCDGMSDYYATATTRRVIIGFSKHNRDLFPEMRAAAATFPETAHLATGDDKTEHREKYSMGSGYYLKASHRYSTGWRVSKEGLRLGVPYSGFAEFHLQPAAMQKAETPGGITIEQHTHTKKGFQMHICILPNRVERSEFEALRSKAEALGGWYSKPWGKTPGGFAFKVESDAMAFAGLDVAAPSPQAVAMEQAPRVGAGMAAKFNEMADAMQKDIDHAFGDRLANTPKRARQAAEARLVGYHLQRTQKALRGLAQAHEAGTVPCVLARVTRKSQVADAMRSHIDRSKAGYYDAGIDTGKPYAETPEALALWAMAGGTSESDNRAEGLRQAISKLQFANIEGYFPTPDAEEGFGIYRRPVKPDDIGCRELDHIADIKEKAEAQALLAILRGHSAQQTPGDAKDRAEVEIAADKATRQLACEEFGSDEIEIELDAPVSRNEDGAAWVQAWLYVHPDAGKAV